MDGCKICIPGITGLELAMTCFGETKNGWKPLFSQHWFHLIFLPENYHPTWFLSSRFQWSFPTTHQIRTSLIVATILRLPGSATMMMAMVTIKLRIPFQTLNSTSAPNPLIGMLLPVSVLRLLQQPRKSIRNDLLIIVRTPPKVESSPLLKRGHQLKRGLLNQERRSLLFPMILSHRLTRLYVARERNLSMLSVRLTSWRKQSWSTPEFSSCANLTLLPYYFDDCYSDR